MQKNNATLDDVIKASKFSEFFETSPD